MHTKITQGTAQSTDPTIKNQSLKPYNRKRKQANSTLTLQLQVNQPQQERNTKIFQQIRY